MGIYWGFFVLHFLEYVVIVRRASPVPVKNLYLRPNPAKLLRVVSGNIMGSVFLNFNLGVQSAPIHFQHITINFDDIGKMYGFFTGSVEARRTILKYAKKKKKIFPQYIPN